MRRTLLVLTGLALLSACAPTLAPLQLPPDCPAEESAELPESSWLSQESTWRLRQTMLLESRFRKLPMEGFLRLDRSKKSARLVALNEVGLVLFDLEVSGDDATLHRIIPPLQKQQGLITAMSQGLRRMFPGGQPAEEQIFTLDCNGDLRARRGAGKTENWRVHYSRYTEYESVRLPREIILADANAGIKLTIELYEVKQEL